MVTVNVSLYSRIAFLVGVVFLFISLFVEWYSFQVIDENSLKIASWSYRLFGEWSTKFSAENRLNEAYRPKNLNISLIIVSFFIIVLISATVVASWKDIDSQSEGNNLRRYSYIPLSLVLFVVFYIVFFPIFYLLPHKLYFPGLTSIDSDNNLTFTYSISIGYILQMGGLICIFSYSLYYYVSIGESFKRMNRPSVHIEKIIQQVQEPLDFDKYIAEEEIKKREV